MLLCCLVSFSTLSQRCEKSLSEDQVRTVSLCLSLFVRSPPSSQTNFAAEPVKPSFRLYDGSPPLPLQILTSVHQTPVLKEGPALMVSMHLSVFVHSSGLEPLASLVRNSKALET